MRRSLVAGLVLVIVILGLFAWHQHNAAEEADLQLGLASSRILTESFSATNELKVSTLRGTVVAKATDPGFAGLLPSSTTVLAPYDADYFVDLGKASPSDFVWNAKDHVMTVTLDDPRPAPANIHEDEARVVTRGVFVSRRAMTAMAKTASKAMAAKVGERTSEPDNMAKAREAARRAVSANASAPLRAAGVTLGGIEVRFRSEGQRNTDHWDYTLPIDQVPAKLEELRKRWP